MVENKVEDLEVENGKSNRCRYFLFCFFNIIFKFEFFFCLWKKEYTYSLKELWMSNPSLWKFALPVLG